jgi:alpha-mannosidase
MVPGQDQIPGTCHDYYTAQGWVDFNDGENGITIATPENPMVQFGSFHFGHNQSDFDLERAHLLGWVTNNYWETNFRAHQPGQVRARYRIRPYSGPFDEGQTHRFGLEAAHSSPLLQQLGERPAETTPLGPGGGSLLFLPGSDGTASSVLTLHVKPAADRPGIVVRLLNTSEEMQQATIGSNLWHIKAAHDCDLLERPGAELDVNEGAVALNLAPRRIATIHLEVTGPEFARLV